MRNKRSTTLPTSAFSVVLAYIVQTAGALTFGICVPLASYNNFDLGYGVTSKIWDKVFGTELKLNKKEKNAMGL